jgi:two-component system LytT family response regulator
MRAILVDYKPKGIHALKKSQESGCQQAVIESDYSNAIAAKQRLEVIHPDSFQGRPAAGQAEALLHNINKTGSPLEMRLCLPTQKGFSIVKLEEIVYCEAQRSYTRFHLLNNKFITVSNPLFDYDKVLTDTTFLRVHKSFLINLLHVKEYTRGEGGTVIMSNNMEIEVSRRKKKQFLIKIKESFKY